MQTFQRTSIPKLDQRQTFDRHWYPENIYYINKIAISNENICLTRELLIIPSKDYVRRSKCPSFPFQERILHGTDTTF